MSESRERAVTKKRIFAGVLGTALITSPVGAQEKIIDRDFIVLNGLMVASSFYDAAVTAAALKQPGAHEANPAMAPFVKEGELETFLVTGAVAAGTIYLSYKMKASKNPEVRKYWWVVPATSITAHILAGTLNLRYVNNF